MKLQKNNKISLVLSGGSALGFSHIGVIKALREFNITPCEISCTSMGSIIGAAYSLGMSTNKIEEISNNFMDLVIENLKNKKTLNPEILVESMLKKVFGKNTRLNQVKIPLKIIATSTETGEYDSILSKLKAYNIPTNNTGGYCFYSKISNNN